MLIDIQSLYKIYNEGKESEVRALDGVSLQIEKGEFVAIVGQSGSGKSTMMNVLGCLDIPTYGDYFLDGTDVTSLTDKQLAHVRNKEIGFIFQGYNLIQELDALENVTLPLIYQGISVFDREDIAMEALAKVGMDDRAHHRPNEMSGGQQQRVAIARAIATKPPIIMADEPTGALDSKTGKHVLEILRDLYRSGTTILLITHDDGIAATAKRVVRLSDGRIIADHPQEVDWECWALSSAWRRWSSWSRCFRARTGRIWSIGRKWAITKSTSPATPTWIPTMPPRKSSTIIA